MTKAKMQGSGNKLKLIDLFSGAGGMTLGFVDPRFSGAFECVFALDNDQAAIDTHNLNFEGHGICANIEEFLREGNEVPAADIVIGGPPCQGFSLLNRNRTGDERRALWEPYMDFVERSGARIFVIENVPGLAKSEEADQIRERAKEIGFETKISVLNTADYGVAQTRKRTIIFGWKVEVLGEDIHFPPDATHSSPNIKTNLPDWVSVREVISDLPAPIGTELRDVEPPLNLHFGRSPTEISQRRYRAVPPGGNRFDLQENAPELTPNCWLKKKSGGTDLFGRLWWDRPSVTIRTEFFKPEKGRYLHPEAHRPITHREAARIMGFPDDFRFAGTKIEIARQIGNAVPPLLASAIAKHIAIVLMDRKKKVA